ncbi:MAG TPA: hemerythrin domain-containing protein [Candidatus Sulfotelmatobacter sp.]|jgi:hypothetical protein|nr:hemerythrin domain-containing protein [Candidatus Sulfotelmatobacter sp.]
MSSKTEIFRHHHTEVRDLTARIEQLLNLQAVTADPGPVATVVRELFGKFGVHLAIEDATLYPRMLNHADAQIRETARKFQAEMGGMKASFDDYRHRWPGPSVISRDPQGFIDQTRKILAALSRRISCEDSQLYDLYDQAA